MAKRNKVAIPPDPSVFRRLASTNMPIERAIAELVDNSIDSFLCNSEKLKKAGTTRATVRVEFGHQRVSVLDDCLGMPSKDLIDAFCLGKSHKGKMSLALGLVGKYGIGLKAAAMVIGKRFTVRTRRMGEDKAIEMSLDVDDLERDGWYLDPPSTVKVGFEHGTEIEITKLRKEYNKTTKDKVKEASSRIFGHYISDGQLSLFIDGQPIDAYHEPVRPGTHRAFEINLGQFGKVKGWVGLLPKVQSHSGRYGFTLVRNNRVVEEYRQVGVRKSNSESKVVGELFLDNWDVDFTKAKIPEDLPAYQLLDEKLRKEIEPELRVNKREANPGKFKSNSEDSTTGVDLKKILDVMPRSLGSTLALLTQTGELQRKPGAKTQKRYEEDITQLLMQHEIGSCEYRAMGSQHPLFHARRDDVTGIWTVSINSDRPFVKQLNNEAKKCLALLLAAQLIGEQKMEPDEQASLRTLQESLLTHAEKELDEGKHAKANK